MDISVTLIVIWKLLAQKSRKLQSHLNFTEKTQDSEKKQSSGTFFLNTNTPTLVKENRKKLEGRKNKGRKDGQGKEGKGKE